MATVLHGGLMPYLSHRDGRFAFDLPSPREVPLDATRVTVVIGSNGTGKSQLLRSVAETARTAVARGGTEALDGEMPIRRVLAVSNLTTDVFVNTSRNRDSYRYLGLRQSSNSSSTGALRQATVSALFSYLSANPAGGGLIPVFRALQIEHYEVVFVSSNRRDYLGGLPRALERELRLLRYQSQAEDTVFRSALQNALEGLMPMLGDSSTPASMISPVVEELSKIEERFAVEVPDLLRLIRRLLGFDLAFRFRMESGWVLLEDLSTGQLLLLSTFARMVANCEPGALILIDEPEMGLHPNWQSSWTSMAREALNSVPGVHVLLATHSPFFVSDGDDVLVPAAQWGSFEQFVDPYRGRSVENILYRVFNAKVMGNQMVEQDLTTLVAYLNDSGSSVEARSALRRLRSMSGADTPDLNSLMVQAESLLDR